jgi:hypothetical protein
VVQIPVEIAATLCFRDQGIEHTLPEALLTPPAKTAVDRLPGAIALR